MPFKGVRLNPGLILNKSEIEYRHEGRVPPLHTVKLLPSLPSPQYLEGSKVGSCRKVLKLKGKSSLAVPYFNRSKSKEQIESLVFHSMSQQHFKLTEKEHVGSKVKHLVRYSPSAFRNRLVQSNRIVSNEKIVKMKRYTKQFTTTYNNYFSRKDNLQEITHQGILCEKTIWQHKRLQL